MLVAELARMSASRELTKERDYQLEVEVEVEKKPTKDGPGPVMISEFSVIQSKTVTPPSLS